MSKSVHVLVEELHLPDWLKPHMRHLLQRAIALNCPVFVPLKKIYGADEWERLSRADRLKFGQVVRFYSDMGLIPLERFPTEDSSNHWRYRVMRD